jgi:hypothetical protein
MPLCPTFICWDEILRNFTQGGLEPWSSQPLPPRPLRLQVWATVPSSTPLLKVTSTSNHSNHRLSVWQSGHTEQSAAFVLLALSTLKNKWK